MSNSSLKILEMVSDYLLDNPKERWCQALFSLNLLCDDDRESVNYYTTDEEVVERIKEKTLTLWDLPY